MQIMYKSTRGGAEEVTASQAVLNGLAPDGLYGGGAENLY